MALPESVLTFSGTSVENFLRLASLEQGRVIYRKDELFDFPHVFYTKDFLWATYHTRSKYRDPLIMCATLLPSEINPAGTTMEYPVDYVLIPSHSLPLEKFPILDRNGRIIDYFSQFEHLDIQGGPFVLFQPRLFEEQHYPVLW